MLDYLWIYHENFAIPINTSCEISIFGSTIKLLFAINTLGNLWFAWLMTLFYIFLHFCTHLSSYVHPGMFSIYQLLTTQKYEFYAFRKGGGIQDIFVAKILMHKMKILFTPLHILLHSFFISILFHKCTKTLMKYALILWM